MKKYEDMNEYEKAEFDIDPYRVCLREEAARAAAQPEQEPVEDHKVVRLITKEQIKPKPAPQPGEVSTPYHVIIGTAVIEVIKNRGEDLLFTEKATYYYSNGMWSMAVDGLTTWLNIEIERAAQYFRQPSNNKLINEARGWILRQKKLFRKHDEIPWDNHGLVPTKSGLVNPLTHRVRPACPDDYCTWRVEVEYDPAATCPWWLQMLDDVFADKTEDERGKTICVIQELLGAGLIDDKPRELSRALVFQGGSNFGKSGLLDVLSGLFGREVNSTPIDSLESPHGMMQFIKRKPWVLHEAFDQRKWHFSSNVKAIVTGDPVQVNVKNGAIWTLRIKAPIFWGTNHPPKFKESTKAITNRLVVIECSREFFEERPVGAAVEANRLRLGKPSNLVLKQEMPGVLAWAMAGLKRGLERGRLVLTKSMSDTIEEIRKDSNLVAGFLEECVFYDPDHMVSRTDFCVAFSAWWQAERGETYSAPNNELIGKAVVAMNDPLIATGSRLKDTYHRYFAGIVLNPIGLSYHQAGADSHHLEAKLANTTGPGEFVNKLIPESWKQKSEVIAMQAAQRKNAGYENSNMSLT